MESPLTPEDITLHPFLTQPQMRKVDIPRLHPHAPLPSCYELHYTRGGISRRLDHRKGRPWLPPCRAAGFQRL